jgi:hypothetical protein
MMNYEDERSEHGRLEATRPSRKNNFRFSRFIVNAGTEEAPFYKALRGSDLGPGGAEAFHDPKWKHLYTEFSLKERTEALKSGNTIKSLGPCVEMLRGSTSTKRKPDLYVRVEYHQDEAKNPLAKSRPTVEWLTRTELVQFVGKKYAGRQEDSMMATYKKKQLYFQICKERLLHPGTRKPLSSLDFEEYPWLFPDGAGPPKATVSETTEDGDPMQGVVRGNEDED